MRRPSRWFVAALVLLGLGVLLTLRLTSTVTSPVGGYSPVQPRTSGSTTPGAAVPTVTDLRGTWLPRVVLGKPVRPSTSRTATLEFRTGTMKALASNGCNHYVYAFALDASGGLHVQQTARTVERCPYRPGGYLNHQRALELAASARIVEARLQLLDSGGAVLAVYDRAR
jgi:hypothetical protein